MGPYKVLPLQASVDLGAMAMKGYTAFPKAPASLNFIIRLFSAISRTMVAGGVLTPLQKCSRCILNPQPTGQNIQFNYLGMKLNQISWQVVGCAEDLVIVGFYAPAQAETLIHSLKRASAGIGLHVNAHKIHVLESNRQHFRTRW